MKMSEKMPFTVGPAQHSSSSDHLVDLGELFADEFLPEGMDFTDFFKDLEGADQFAIGDDYKGYTIGNVAPDAFTNPSSDISMGFSNVASGGKDLTSLESILENQKHPSLPMRNQRQPFDAMMAGGGGDPNTSKQGVIMVPPSMPAADAIPTGIGNIFDQPLYDPAAPLKKRLSTSKMDVNQSVNAYLEEENDGRKRRKKTKGVAPANMDPLTLTEQQKLERRERNREHAKRSRIRKKVLLDLLQDQLSALRNENVKLRRVVVEKIPKHATNILSQCTTEESLLLLSDGEDEDGGTKKSRTLDLAQYTESAPTVPTDKLGQPVQHARILMEPDFRLIQALCSSQQNFVLSDPSLPDNPIVYCSEGFCKITGYRRHEIIGRNCRFLQGPGTDANAVDVIRKGVAEGRDISVCLLNYKADGTPFWNQFFVAALRDGDGSVVNYVGVQCEVNVPPISQIKDRVKKLPIK